MEVAGGDWETNEKSDLRHCVLGSRCLWENAPCFWQDMIVPTQIHREYSGQLPVIDIINRDRPRSIKTWFKPHESKTLFIGRYDCDGDLTCWTTDVFLEFMALFEGLAKTNAKIANNHVLLAHLCDSKRNGVGSVETMIQDLLAQLCKHHEHVFINHKTCVKWSQAVCTTTKDANNARRLWELFEQCITGSGIQRLIIMLNNVDAMVRSDDRDGFIGFLQHLCSFIHRKDREPIIVKLLMTNKSHPMEARIDELLTSVNVSFEKVNLEYPPRCRIPEGGGWGG